MAMISFEQSFYESRHVVNQEIYYHGTCANHLRDILVNGLHSKPHLSTYKDPAKDTSLGSREAFQDLYPYGGSYLALSLLTAWGYATDKFRETASNPVLVVCKISPYSGYLDEDILVGIIRGLWWDNSVKTVNGKFDVNTLKVLPDESSRKALIDKHFEKFIWRIEADLYNKQEIKVNFEHNKDILKNIYLALLYKNVYEFRSNINILTKRLKKYTRRRATVRITEPITFSGRNRILGIYEGIPTELVNQEFYSGSPQFQYALQSKVHYLSPTMRPELSADILKYLDNAYVWSDRRINL